jgi:hypothetical protein
MKNLLFILLLAVVAFFACKKTDAPAPEPLPPATPIIDTTGTLNIDISHVVNNTPLLLSSTSYTNTHADTFKVDLLKYYISNVQLITASGYTYTEAESYYLIDHSSPSSLQLSIKKVPRANYSYIKFLIGVDSLHNVSGAQTGALDPANAMFWTWNSGYIMAKFEGTSNQSGDPTKKLTFHLGGFYGPYSSVRTIYLPFPNAANVSETHTPIVNTKAEIAQWFSNPNVINFTTTYAVTTAGSSSKAIADNYASMFSITSVVN